MAAGLSLLLPACGGGGGSGGAAPELPILIGTHGQQIRRLSRPDLEAVAVTTRSLGLYYPLEGLEYDPVDDAFYAGDRSTGHLVRIAASTGEVVSVGPLGFGGIRSLALHPVTRDLYASTWYSTFVKIDRSTARCTILGRGHYDGLAFNADGSALYGIESNGSFLSVDPATGDPALLGNKGFFLQGLAFDPGTGLLHTYSGSTHKFVRFDPVAGTFTEIAASVAVSGLAFVPSLNRLAAVVQTSLVHLDPSTGAQVFQRQVGLGAFRDLAYDPDVDAFYGVSASLLCIVPRSTGLQTVIGETGVAEPAGLAFDPDAGVLYGSAAGTLHTFDLATGAGTAVGSIGYSVSDLAWRPQSGMLFGTAGGDLIRIDPATGAGTVVGSTGLSEIISLACDPSDGTLYAERAGTLYAVDPTTASPAPVTDFVSAGVEGLDFCPMDGLLYASDTDSPHLFRIDPVSGSTRAVNVAGGTLLGLAWDPASKTLYAAADAGTRRLVVVLDPVTGSPQSSVAIDAVFNQDKADFTFDPDRAALYTTSDVDHLLRIDPADGSVTDVGATGVRMDALAYHPPSAALFGLDASSGSGLLHLVDRDTGAATFVRDLGFYAVSLAYDPSSGLLLAYDPETDRIVRLDPASGTQTILGQPRYAAGSMVVPH